MTIQSSVCWASVVAALGLSAVACSSDAATPAGTGTGGGSGAGTGGATSSGPPTVKIDDPKGGETVGPSAEYADYPDVPIAFTVTGFTLKAPGACAGATSCGHLHLMVDGKACNDVANKAPYNNAGATSPINAGLDYCAKVEGEHTVSLEIHNDDHSPVKGADGNVISDSIKITALPESAADAGKTP